MAAMRKLFLVPVLMLALMGGIALAAQVSNTYQSSSSTPSGAAGIVQRAGVPMTGDSIKRIAVTVSDYRDGGSGDALDWVQHFEAQAWVYNAALVSPDGGQGWSRVPALDISVDAGTAYQPAGVTGYVTVSGYPGIPGSRLFYTVGSLNASADGGQLVTNTTITQQQ